MKSETDSHSARACVLLKPDDEIGDNHIIGLWNGVLANCSSRGDIFLCFLSKTFAKAH